MNQDVSATERSLASNPRSQPTIGAVAEDYAIPNAQMPLTEVAAFNAAPSARIDTSHANTNNLRVRSNHSNTSSVSHTKAAPKWHRVNTLHLKKKVCDIVRYSFSRVIARSQTPLVYRHSHCHQNLCGEI
jgi:hypothetical protein